MPDTTTPQSRPAEERLPQPRDLTTLRDERGNPVRLSSFKQRQPVLVALLHGPSCDACRGWLRQLASEAEQLDDLRVAVVPVLPASEPELSDLRAEPRLPFMLAHADALRDEPGAVQLVALDRYGATLETWRGRDADAFPTLSSVFATFAYAENDDCACAIAAWGNEP